MKIIYDRKFIENIEKNAVDESFSAEIQLKVENLMVLSIEQLSKRVPFITLNNVSLQPVNETFNGAFAPSSKYVYLLGVDSSQLELNCLNYSGSWKKFKKRLKLAWQDTRRKKRRKKKIIEESHEFEEFEPEKYNLDSLRRDLQLVIASNLSVTSIVYNTTDRLIIQGKDDFGSVTQIEIIPCIYDGEYYKYFLGKRKGFLNINIDERLMNFEIKNEICGENFNKMLLIFNNVLKSMTKQSVNQIFLESLLYNVPAEFFEGEDVYKMFVSIVNFLNMTDVSKFVSIENKTETIFKSKLMNSAALFNKLVRALD